jgi:threonine synthase
VAKRLVCSSCRKSYAVREPRWRCQCGSLLDLEFLPRFDLLKIEDRPPSIWRYREALPIEEDGNIVSFGEGFTPLQRLTVAGKEVLFKLDYLFPSGSFKDRGAALLVSKLKEWGIRQVVEDSSGNAGSSIATYCARAGIECRIFVPRSTSAAKCSQILACGAQLHRVDGSREDTEQAALAAAEDTFYASHVWNPFFLQGTRTFAFEVCEQLGWRAPGTLAAAVGNGSLLLGAYIGFQELMQARIIDRIPRLVAVQAQACAPLVHAFDKGTSDIPPIQKQETLAEGIAVAAPRRGRQILEAVRRTGGCFIAVTEAEIQESLMEMGSGGFYIEPTSAAAAAGVKKFLLHHTPPGPVVSTLTGHGLKAPPRQFAP